MRLGGVGFGCVTVVANMKPVQLLHISSAPTAYPPHLKTLSYDPTTSTTAISDVTC